MNLDMSLITIVTVVATLLISLGFHEAMHAYTAHLLGDDTAEREGRLTINPLAHIDLLTTVLLPTVLLILGLPPILAAKPVPFNPGALKYEEFGAALVGIAGPLTNLALATVAALLLNVGAFSGSILDVAYVFIYINIGLFVFNMLPFPPLDGSRVLYAFAPRPVQEVMERIEQFGIFIILGLFLLMAPIVGPILINMNQAVFNFLVR